MSEAFELTRWIDDHGFIQWCEGLPFPDEEKKEDKWRAPVVVRCQKYSSEPSVYLFGNDKKNVD